MDKTQNNLEEIKTKFSKRVQEKFGNIALEDLLGKEGVKVLNKEITNMFVYYINKNFTPNSQIKQSNEKYLTDFVESLLPVEDEEGNTVESWEEIENDDGYFIWLWAIKEKFEQYKSKESEVESE